MAYFVTGATGFIGRHLVQGAARDVVDQFGTAGLLLGQEAEPPQGVRQRGIAVVLRSSLRQPGRRPATGLRRGGIDQHRAADRLGVLGTNIQRGKAAERVRDDHRRRA